MKYQGLIKRSRTLDLAALTAVVDAAAIAFLAYNPAQLGLEVPAYFAVRLILTALQAYLRYKTTGPVGAK